MQKKENEKVTKKVTKTIVENKKKNIKPKKKSSKIIIKNNINKESFIYKILKNVNFIKLSFLDVALLYKNLINWNTSKIMIFLWSIIIGFISIIPFIIIFIIYSFFSELNINSLIDGLYSGILLNSIFGNIILFGIIFIGFITYLYSNILLISVYNSYKNKKKYSITYKEFLYFILFIIFFPITVTLYIFNKKFNKFINKKLPFCDKLGFFNFKKIVRFFQILLLSISILLIPVILFVILMAILILFSGGLSNIGSIINSGIYNYFTLLSIGFYIINLLLFIYIFYRIIFSFFILGEKSIYDKKKSTTDYIKESIIKTKKIKNLFKFIVIIIIFVGLVSPLIYLGKILDNNNKLLNDYSIYMTLSEEQKNNISTEDIFYVENLVELFNGKTQNEISNDIKINYVYLILYKILSFIFLSGLFLMIFSSFYKRELK